MTRPFIPHMRSFLTAALVAGASLVHGQLLKVAVAGMNHDHVHSILQQFQKKQVIILGIAESDNQLIARYKKQYALADSLFYPTLTGLLDHVHPDVVLAYNPISEHVLVVEVCAPRKISVMVEKPLATTNDQANRIAALVKQYGIHVLTNYETTWYPSNQHIFTMVHQPAIGNVLKMVVHDGHQGPKEIGCSPDFLEWLTDPVKNGGGALMDFGCYGANLMTWMMNGMAPISVSAITHQIKPDLYPHVDDDANIVLEYENATGIIEASWNWPFGIKDFEVFGTHGYLHALNGTTLQERKQNVYENIAIATPTYQDNLTYLADVLRGKTIPGNDLSSLNNNLVVVRILEAARQSAKEGKKILLTP